ncbi:MAG: hypothetical protein IRZ15_17940 [Bryobacteraceae bacterium]|nr:hypothetical protein [Bryobacteraceae bacterium]
MRDFDVNKAMRYALFGGAAVLIISIIGAFFSPADFFRAYLIGYVFWAGLALGSLSIVLLHHLVGGDWGFITRRFMESAFGTLPLLALLSIPILVNVSTLYPWARPEVVAESPVLQQKVPYLNVPFFIGRIIIYFAIWIGLAWMLNRWSQEQDETADPLYVRRFRSVSGPALILHAFIVTFAAIDLLKSLEPEWYSTIFGLIILVGQLLTTIAFSIMMLMLLSDREPFTPVLRTVHFLDLGNLLLTFVVLFAYVEVSQFIIIWHGNLPEEVPWYTRRSTNGWEYVTVLLVLFHFAVPFFLLLTRYVKQRLRLLASIAIAILVMRLLDYFWIVLPAFNLPAVGIHWMDVLVPVGIGGIWLAYFFWRLQRRPMLPLGDTRFVERV